MANDGTLEKEINLNIARNLREILEFNGFSVIMTREGDVGTDSLENANISARKRSDLNNRLKLMKRYSDAVFVSVHLNKFTTSAASGAQVFYSKKMDESMQLAESIQASFVSILQPENKRVVKQGSSSAFLLKNATIPAVIVECGFLSNHRELLLLKDEEYQKKIAFTIASGILDFYNKKGV